MLNISDNSILDRLDTRRYGAFQRTVLPPANRMFRRWLLTVFVVSLVIMFLPWTQNIQTTGKVTTLDPSQRPQTIHATIAGRIEQWYVREGDLVKAGDTIVRLAEVKTDYFDPQLVERTGSQVTATAGALNAYGEKAAALEGQVAALRQELALKKPQLENKLQQGRLKINSDSIEWVRARVDFDIAQTQFQRTQEMYAKGLAALTQLEQRNLKVQETAAKKIEAENKWLIARNEVDNARLELLNLQNEYANKIAKAQSDKFSTLSEGFDTEAKLSKLRVDLENYRMRGSFYFITAPQDCYITQALVNGIGETVKEGTPIVSIMPDGAKLAVEMHVKPIDLPLMRKDKRVNFIFDGWPAIVFSGWPDLAFGTFEGKVFAIDNNISPNGKYRVLVAPDEARKPFPAALRPGGGAQCIALLGEVPVWYELWRKLNGFPPDFYTPENVADGNKK